MTAHPGHVPFCTHRTGRHRWKVTHVIPFRIFGVLPPALRARCTRRRCGLEVNAEITTLIRPLTPNTPAAAHAATTKENA